MKLTYDTRCLLLTLTAVLDYDAKRKDARLVTSKAKRNSFYNGVDHTGNKISLADSRIF
jgi:hypothetical protein